MEVLSLESVDSTEICRALNVNPLVFRHRAGKMAVGVKEEKEKMGEMFCFCLVLKIELSNKRQSLTCGECKCQTFENQNYILYS